VRDVIDLLVKKLFITLNANFNYAVLRGYEELPDNFSSHDIDIIVDKNEFSELKRQVSDLIDEFDCRLIMVNETERFVTFIIAKRVGDEVRHLYLDFFFNFSLYGICFVAGDKVLLSRIFNGKVYHVSLVFEFLEKFLNTRLLGAEYPEKYTNVLASITSEHESDLRYLLVEIFNRKVDSLLAFNSFGSSRLLIVAFLSSLRRQPISQLAMSCHFLFFYIRNRLKPNGFSLSFTGPDGSGKTTLLTAVNSEISKIYREVAVKHFRPTILPRIAEVFNSVGLKDSVDRDYHKPHRGELSGGVSSFTRLFYYLLDYIVGHYRLIEPVLFRRGVVIFDRHFTDIASDGRRSKIDLNYRFIFAFRRFVPSIDYNFIVFAAPHEVLNRKKELTETQIIEIYEKLDFICDEDERYLRINNDLKPRVAVNMIIDHIFDKQDQKYSRSLNAV
jgi:thymidylate kinase